MFSEREHERDAGTDGAIAAELAARGSDGATLAALAERLGMDSDLVAEVVRDFRRRGVVRFAGWACDPRGRRLARWVLVTRPEPGEPPGSDEGAGSLAGESGATKAETSDAKRPEPKPGTSASLASTSAEAFRRVAGAMPAQRAAVLAVILRAGAAGATDREIEAATGLRQSSVTPRRIELRDLGVVCDSGRFRVTPSGCRATVWVAAQFARTAEGGAA